MDMVRCPNGHYYDAEKSSTCPYCGGAPIDQGEDETTMGLVGIRSTVHSGGRPGQSRNAWPESSAGKDVMGRRAGENDETQSFVDEENIENDDTVGLIPANIKTQKKEGAPIEEARSQMVDPVVGWLVCTEGSHYGESFGLYAGKNFIGRASNMDVCLAGDNTVSREVHAILVYEPRKRIFFVHPGDSHSLFYLNDNVVLSTIQIKDRDVLTVGQTTLVFVPFCDATYGWGV